MIQVITLTGEPKSTGHIYKHACRGRFPTVYMSKDGKDLKESYKSQVKKQYKGEVIKGKIQTIIRLYFGTKRKQDIDNFNKILLDSLTGIVWEDDCQIEEMIVSKFYDKSNPRIEIEVTELQ